MNIPQSARLEGLHRRHHLNRGIKKPGCTFCELPSLGTKKGDKPVTVPQPAPEPDHYEQLQKEAEVNAAKALEKDRLWAAAQSGMTALQTMKIMGIEQLTVFLMTVENYFGKPWVEVVEQARLCAKRDITSAAIREAQAGNSRLLLKLMDEGFFSTWIRDEHQESIRTATTEELEQRMLALFPNVRDRYERFKSDTLKMTPASEEDVRAFETKKPAEYEETAVPVKTEVATFEPSQDKVEVKQQMSTRDEDRLCVSNDESSPTPCIYYPEPGIPLQPRISRDDL